jgi:hypothetical protein
MRAVRILVSILLVLCVGLLTVQAANAATSVYYSVGQNTNDNKTGSPTVTIVGGTATFSVAQTATNMGVGDRVTYNGTVVAYISGKVSTTQWTLVTATGAIPAAVPSAVTVNSIAHEYGDLQAAITGAKDATHLNTANLTVGDHILNIPCYFDTGAETDSGVGTGNGVTVSGYTTSPSDYIKIYTPNNTQFEVNQSQRHPGFWTDTAYHIDSGNWYGSRLVISNSNVKIIGLQIGSENHDGDTDEILVTTATPGQNIAYTGIEIGYCIIRGGVVFLPVVNYGIHIDSTVRGSTVSIYNNMIYNTQTAGIMAEYTTGSHIYVYNCTLVGPNITPNISKGISANLEGDATLEVINTIAQGWSTGFGLSEYDGSSDYNISNLTTDAPGSHSKQSTIVTFVNAAANDYHLSPSDTAARGAGTNLSGSETLFNDDIDGQTRVNPWDIGADQIFTVVPPTVITTATTAITSTTATGNGNVTSAGGGTVTDRGVCYGITASPVQGGSGVTCNPASTGGTGTFSVNITGLTPGQTYHVQAYATTSVSTVYGGDLSFTAGSVPAAVTTTATTAITSTTATGNGNVTSAGSGTVTVRGVCYGIAASPIQGGSGVTCNPASAGGIGTFSVNITGLTPSQTYHVQAYATTSVSTVYGGDVSFTALSPLSVPAAVTTTATTAITSTTAIGNGNVTSAGSGTVTVRGVCYGIAASPVQGGSGVTCSPASTGGTGTFSVNITGLTLGQTYHVQAYATTSVSTVYGGDLSFTALLFKLPKIGVFSNGTWYLDINGDGAWDSGDLMIPDFGTGLPNVVPVTGDWNGSGTTKIGVFSNGTWYLDMNGNGAWDGPSVDKVIPNFGVGLPNAIPVVGNWPGSAGLGDKIGVFSNGTWYLDKSGNGIWDGPSTDIMVSNFGVGLPNAIPVVGDWNNTGVTRIGVFSNGTWYLDINGDGAWDGPSVDKVIPNFGVGLPNAIPVILK